MNDCPEPDRFPRPDAVIAVETGRLPIPKRQGFHATTNLRPGCLMCHPLYLQHEHDGMAAFPF
jgi:hypothetical protein